MCMQRWWNVTDRGIMKFLGRNIFTVCVVGEKWVWSIVGMVPTGEN